MGCDIHVYAEHKKSASAYAKWQFAGHMDVPSNYVLFALLAGVRNYHGFMPIAPPRGLPTDVTEEAKAEADSWGSDGHSHSWLTVAEIDAAHMEAQRASGCISLRQYRKWRESKDSIFEWAEEAVPVTGVKLKLEELALLARSDAKSLDGGVPYSVIPGAHRASVLLGDAWSDLRARLLELGDPDSVRIVFWFDN